MSSKLVVAVLAALALGCTACGGTQRAVLRVKTVRTKIAAAKAAPADMPPLTNFVVLPPTHGAGDASLGTFTMAGRFGDIEVQCTGKSPMTVAGLWTVPCGRNGAVESLGFDTVGQRINLTVRAKPGTTWWLAVGERIPTLVRRPVVLLRRTGSGKASLGTFRVSGDIHVETTCKGAGQLIVSVSSHSPHFQNTFSDDYCPAADSVMTIPGGSGTRVRVAVTRAPKGTWGVTVREAPPK